MPSRTARQTYKVNSSLICDLLPHGCREVAQLTRLFLTDKSLCWIQNHGQEFAPINAFIPPLHTRAHVLKMSFVFKDVGNSGYEIFVVGHD